MFVGTLNEFRFEDLMKKDILSPSRYYKDGLPRLVACPALEFLSKIVKKSCLIKALLLLPLMLFLHRYI